MLTYTDCLELKEAGFPQEGRLEPMFYPTGEGNSCGKFEMIFVPILEELIEACGEGFGSIVNNTGCWTAIGVKYPKALSEYKELQETIGSSPIQAVKNLYCALQRVGTAKEDIKKGEYGWVNKK